MKASIRNTRVAACLALAVIIVVPETALADEAKESFERGVELFKADDYQGALAEFLSAYKTKPHHGVLYNIAQCYKMIDAGADALYYYELYLEKGADQISDSRRKLVEKEIEKLKVKLTPLNLDIEPDGAKLLLDGKEIGVSPVKTHYLDPGEHTLNVQKEGYEAHRQEFVAKRGKPIDIEVVLEEAEKPVDEEQGEEAMEEDEGEGAEPLAASGSPPSEESAPAAKVPWGAAVATGALTLASGAAAIVLGVMNSKHHDEYMALRSDIADGTYTGDDSERDIRDTEDKGKALNAGVGVAIGVTAAAAVVTAVLAPLAVPKKRVDVQASGTGISVTVAF